ncbi:MAG: RNA degradosome polyphosphate kinase, partial [Solirubrobacterales bacterium]
MTDPDVTQSQSQHVISRDAFETTTVPATRTTAETAARELQADEVDLRDREYFFNRELSWMDFNDRVLQLAEQKDLPLLERVKFSAIFSSNLDEFIMIRLAGMHDLIDAGIEKRGPDGRTPDETVDGVGERAREQLARQSRLLSQELIPQL